MIRPEDSERFNVTKLDAARRQLATAITLWFHDGDTVAIHTLAFAAYEIIHVISKKRNRTQGLLFDSHLIKDEYRGEWNKHLKGPANFFKHAKNDADGSIEFSATWPLMFILFSIAGLKACNEVLNDDESAFLFWVMVHKPNWLKGDAQQLLADRVPVENLDRMRTLSKDLFFDAFKIARQRDQTIKRH